jgi:hypothetical protein
LGFSWRHPLPRGAKPSRNLWQRRDAFESDNSPADESCATAPPEHSPIVLD